MKKTTKKIWGAVLTLMMVLSLLPSSAFAEEKYYPVWVGDVQVSEKNKNDVLGDKTVKFDPATSTLTLNNAKITAPKEENDIDTTGIWSSQSINLVLKGQNSIICTPAKGEGWSTGISMIDYKKDEAKNLVISGDGSLVIKGANSASSFGVGVRANNLTIKNGSIATKDIKAKEQTLGLFSEGNFTMINGKLDIGFQSGKNNHGISSFKNVDISGGDIQVKSGDAKEVNVAIFSQKETMIRSGEIIAISGESKESNSIGIFSLEKLTISGGKVIAKAGNANGESKAIFSRQDILIQGGDVSAESGSSENYGSGVDSEQNLVISNGRVTAKTGNTKILSAALRASEKVIIEDGEVYAEATTGQKLGFGISSLNGYLSGGNEPAWIPGEGVDIQGGNVTVKGVPFAISPEPKINESLKSDMKISKEVDGKNASRWDGKPESLSTANFVQIGSNSKTSTGNESSSTVTPSTEVTNGAIKLKIGSKEMIKNVDGADQKTMMDAAPFVSQGRTMVPLRYVAEALGLEVKMDAASKSVVLSNADKKIRIPLNSLKMMANDQEVKSDVLPIVKDGRTYLSISNIGKALGLESGKNLIWDAKAKEITVIP